MGKVPLARLSNIAVRRSGRHLFISFLLLAGSAAADVRESLDYSYYDATARPGQSLAASLNSASPIKEDGRVFHGHTRWNVRWNFWWNERGDRTCKISSAKTSVSATITMPRLVGGDAGQNLAFERYVAALKQHELGHYQIGRDAAMEIDRGILALPAMKDCPSLERAANDGANQALERHRQSERQYDVTTSHGKSQGAWLDR